MESINVPKYLLVLENLKFAEDEGNQITVIS